MGRKHLLSMGGQVQTNAGWKPLGYWPDKQGANMDKGHYIGRGWWECGGSRKGEDYVCVAGRDDRGVRFLGGILESQLPRSGAEEAPR